MKWRYLLPLYLAVAGAADAQAQAPANSLFQALAPGADAGDLINEISKIQGFVAATLVRNRPRAELVQLLQKGSAALNATAADQPDQQVLIDLPKDRAVRVLGRATAADLDRGRWFGDVVGATGLELTGPGSASLSIMGNKVLGTIVVPGATFEIVPQGDDVTSIVEIDTSRAAPDEPPPAQKFRVERRFDEGQRPASDPNVTYVATVIVAYTSAARQKIEGPRKAVPIQFWVTQRINESNQSYTNSNINMRLELAKTLELSYKESGSWTTDRDRFFRFGDNYMDEVMKEREDAKADMALLLFDNPTYCGEAMDIKASRETAFAVVDTASGCTLKFAFTHEIGHLLGAEHNVGDSSNPSSYPWAHGIINGNDWRTMMAYQSGCSPCTRLLYWSSPAIEYKGTKMGTAAQHDNARVLRENARAVSEFR